MLLEPPPITAARPRTVVRSAPDLAAPRRRTAPARAASGARRPSIAAVVPATDAPATLTRCRAAIARADNPPNETVVVDGPAGLGVCEARNLGASLARADVLVFVDADVAVAPDAFDRIRAAFAADAELDALFGSYCDDPPAPGVVSAFRNLLHHHVHQRGAGPAQTFWAGLGAVRRERFAAVGGFDGRRFAAPSVEDVDLGMRLAAAGATIRLDPRLRGTHLKRWTLPLMVRTDFARRAVPWLRLQLRARSVPTGLNLGWRHRLTALACLCAALALVTTWPAGVAAGLGAQVALNHRFYALLARRRGAAVALAGVPLHALHHLTAVAAVPAALLLHARDRRRGPDR